MSDSTSVVVLIGNSDNKLTQNEWSHFVEAMNQGIREFVTHIHFFGGSNPFDPWQNACWVCDVALDKIDGLKDCVRIIRKSHRQESAAMICGTTLFI